MDFLRPMAQGVKALLPKGKRYRVVRFGPASGCTMGVDFNCHVKSYLGIYEYELLPHLKRMIQVGSYCFDIGGKDGYDALMMANMSKAKVISFECDHAAAEEMRNTFALNPALAIEVAEAFVGATDGEQCITIDKACRQFFIPDFIKLDIEGAEDAALNGAIGTLTTHKPHLIVEVHGEDKEQHCVSLLKSFGYTIQIVDQGRFLKDPDRIGFNRWIAAYSPIRNGFYSR
jgi:hypothetical protein